MGRIVETLWNCPYCGNKGIRGGIQTCPGCGKTRSKDTKFYLPNEITYVDKEIDKRPDWYCPYCDSYNPAAEENCRLCGAPRENTENYFEILAKQGVKPDLQNPDERKDKPSAASEDSYEKDYDSNTDSYYRTSNTERNHGSFLTNPSNIFIAITLVIIALITAIFIPRTKTIEIVKSDWERNITIEENRIVEESDWSVPSDAIEVVKTQQEFHHYEHVFDHYETVTENKTREVLDGYDTYYTYSDLGNGYAEEIEHQTPRYRTEYYTESHEEPVYRNEPVYQTKYYYKIWRYVYDHTETTKGTYVPNEISEPYWSDYELKESQRENGRNEKYSVTYIKKQDKTAVYSVKDYDLYSKLLPGNEYKVKVQAGTITEIYENE